MDYLKKPNRTYKILLHKESEGAYTVTIPALPGCITYGENVDHAILMAKEAISLYIAELENKGDEIPDDNDTLEYSMNIETAWILLQSIWSGCLNKMASSSADPMEAIIYMLTPFPESEQQFLYMAKKTFQKVLFMPF